MTTEPARTNPAARALATLILTTVTFGLILTGTLAAVGAPFWLATAPLWAPTAVAYLAVTTAAGVALALALVRPDRGTRG